MTDRTYGKQHQVELINHYMHFTSPNIVTHGVDDQYRHLVVSIKECVAGEGWSRHDRIRLRAWLDKLGREECGGVQRQNRNHYLKVLHLMLECRLVLAPFQAFPGQEIPILRKQDYLGIIQDISRALGRSKESSCRSSQWVSPTASLIKKDHRDSEKCSTYAKKSQQIHRKYTREKSPSQQSTNYLGRYKSNILSDEFDVGSEEVSFHKNDGFCEEGYNIQLFQPAEEKYQGAYESVEAFDEVAGFGMSNFVSKRLKTLINNTSHKKEGGFSQQKDEVIQENRFKKTGKQKQNCLKLTVDDREDERYWESNSYNENNTPKYLHLYPSNPYPSLALSDHSETELERSQLSARNCDCFCDIFSKSR